MSIEGWIVRWVLYLDEGTQPRGGGGITLHQKRVYFKFLNGMLYF